MKLKDLIRRFRTEANDKAQPYFWSDPEVIDWLNDAEEEAALRGRLLYESQDLDVIEIEVTAGLAVYELHPSLHELSFLAFKQDVDSRSVPVILMSPEALDRTVNDWRDRTDLCGRIYAIQSDKTIQLVPVPTQDGTLHLEGYRIPLELMQGDDDEPEINAAHHRHLIQWALHKAFSIPDTEVFDATRAEAAEFEFTRYFGLRPDSDLRRSTREDETQTVKGFFV